MLARVGAVVNSCIRKAVQQSRVKREQQIEEPETAALRTGQYLFLALDLRAVLSSMGFPCVALQADIVVALAAAVDLLAGAQTGATLVTRVTTPWRPK